MNVLNQKLVPPLIDGDHMTAAEFMRRYETMPEDEKAELACLFVEPRHEHQGIGGKLAQYVETIARGLGYGEIFCLSTQAFNFFQQKCGYRAGQPEDLPAERRGKYEKGGRKSQVMVKSLAGPAPDTRPPA